MPDVVITNTLAEPFMLLALVGVFAVFFLKLYNLFSGAQALNFFWFIVLTICNILCLWFGFNSMAFTQTFEYASYQRIIGIMFSINWLLFFIELLFYLTLNNVFKSTRKRFKQTG